MYANVKDLIMLKNIFFKDTQALDYSLTGHPVLIICVTDKHFYYLTLSSSIKPLIYLENGEQYILKKDKHNKLSAPISYINLKNIYKSDLANYVAVGKVKNEIFTNVIECLKYYQENVWEDEYYSEIRGYLSALIDTRKR